MLVNPLLNSKSEFHSNYLDDDVLNLGDRSFTIPQDFSYQVLEVTADYVARMDLVSLNVYNTNQYSDLLCKLNGISNPFELNEGTKLIIPDFNDLDKFYYVESNEEKDSVADSSTETSSQPKAKAKTEKRKPNEAIVGDKRYKVDSSHKVIIY